jgi:hypothetical protein
MKRNWNRKEKERIRGQYVIVTEKVLQKTLSLPAGSSFYLRFLYPSLPSLSSSPD